jgi:ABC-type uncharacterized transport system substrate-binding protein
MNFIRLSWRHCTTSFIFLPMPVGSGRRKWHVALSLLAGMIASPAAAHPHVWIDYSAVVLFDDANVKGVRMTWTFDEMYSSMLFHDYTSRPHGPLTAADVKKLQKGAFEDTKDYHYFVDVVLNGSALPVKEVSDFDASYDGRRMTYRFTVPIHADANDKQSTLEVDSFDTEFYIDFELAKKDPVSAQHGAAISVSCAPKQVPKTTTLFGGLTVPIAACTFSKAG